MMPKRHALLPLLLALLLAVCATALWHVWRQEPGQQRALELASERGSSAALIEGRSSDLVTPKPHPLILAESEMRIPVDTAQGIRGAPMATTEDLELANARWVEGHVIFPPDTPAGEIVRVVALGRTFGSGSRFPHSSDVGPDGRFRVAFAGSTRRATLLLDAPHLYVEPEWFDLRTLEGEVVLEPRVGGRIVGRVVPPEGTRDVQAILSGAMVRLQATRGGSNLLEERCTSGIDTNLRFELRAVPARDSCTIWCTPPGWSTTSLSVQIVAGTTVEVELPLHLGATLRGRAFDPGGGDLSEVSVRLEGDTPFGAGPYQNARLAADGTFEMTGIPVLLDAVRLRASMDGRVDALLRLGELRDGEVREGLELHFVSGGSLSGRVIWSHDGSPARGARVTASEPRASSLPDELEARRSETRSATAGPDGAFVIEGLAGAIWDLEARHMGPAPASPIENVAMPRRTPWIAASKDVSTGTTDLVLHLQPSLAVSGRVTDDLGASIQRFQVSMRRAREYDFLGAHVRTRAFRDSDGRFHLDGLAPGEWILRVEAEGHVSSPPAELVLPRDLGSRQIVLARTSSLAGVVLDTDGKPCPLARVGVALIAGEAGSRGSSTTCDESGRFLADGLAPGTMRAYATMRGFAKGAAVEVHLVPGQRMEGIVLQLRQGVRVTGEVLLDPSPASTWMVVLRDRTRNQTDVGGTDSAGRFAFEDLLPGDYEVFISGRFPPGELASDGIPARPSPAMDMSNPLRITLELGQDAHVVLK